MKRVVLINPYIYHSNVGTITPWDSPPLGLAYLAAMLERAKINVMIIDANIEQLSPKKLLKKLKLINPHVVGITANGYSAKNALFIAKKIKNEIVNASIIMGGPYPTVEYSSILQERFCDICVLGEGELTIVELINCIFNHEDLTNIKGIAFLNKENHVIVTEPQPLIQNLDNLPFPAWHLFPPLKKYKNLRGITRRPYIPILTSRGCPYNCIWCTKNIHGYHFRARSPESVVEEIIYDVMNYHVKEIVIMDDTFSLDEIRLKKICRLLKMHKLDIIFNLYNGIRADTINDSTINYLRAIGINRITVGVESGNQDIVYRIGKSLDLQKVIKAVQICKKYHIIIDGFFILGLPFDTLTTMEQTIQFAIDTDFDHAYFFVAVPFPGTELFDIVKKTAILEKDISKGADHHIVEGIPFFSTSHFTTDIVRKKYLDAYRRFYLRPKKIFSLGLVYSRMIFKYWSIDTIKWLIAQFIHLL